MAARENPPPSVERVVRVIPKGGRSGDEVRVSVLRLSGRRYCDLRLFSRGKSVGGQPVPTRKGVTFAPELLPELQLGLLELERVVREPAP